MRTERLDIRVNRNADYHETWQIRDYNGNPIDLTSYSLDMKIRTSNGTGQVVSTASISKVEAVSGIITVTIDGGSFTSIPLLSQVDVLSYDLRLTYIDGIQSIPVAGLVYLTPGATF